MTRSTICLAMMVHNEAGLLPRVFENVGHRLNSAVIIVHPEYDDDSAEVATKLCEQYGLRHKVLSQDHPQPISGARSRNEVFDLAYEFGEDYTLWLDPDDPLIGTIPDELIAPIYTVETRATGVHWIVEHLVSKDCPDVRWHGDIHEVLRRNGHECVLLEDCFIDRKKSGGGTERMESFDLPLLLAAVEKDPTDLHSWGYLAQTYRDLGKLPEAVAAYNHRAQLGGAPQSTFWARFQVAEITGHPDDYLIAWNSRPERVEPLHRLAALYNAKEQYNVGLAFAMLGLQLPPTDDAMFVERWCEEYGLLGEMAVAQYHLGNAETAVRAWEYILTLDSVMPEHRVVFQHNLDEIRKPKPNRAARRKAARQKVKAA